MPLFRNSSIRHKLTIIVLCTSLLGLGIACLSFEFYERANFRRELKEQLTALADTVGANSGPSLVFNDRKSAEEALAALRAEPHIVAACLYERSGKVFAEYLRSGWATARPVPAWSEDGAQFSRNSLTLHRAIQSRGEKVGSIAIVSDLTALQAKVREYTGIAALVLVIAIFATLFVSSRLLGLITEPILQLANVAGKVSREENYALRAVAQTDDEVGRLIHSFNKMLEGIQERDQKLQNAKDDLELRVEARTNELQSEVEERVRAQEALSEERKILRTLIDNVPDSMYVKDAECRFIVANIAVARQMGANSPEKLLGKTDFDFYPRDLAATFYEDEQRVIRSGHAEVNREEPALDAQGNAGEALTTQVPLRDKNGRVTGLAGISRDITQLKKVQAEMQRAREVAEKASRAKSEFLANMSHEIRTPLNGIMGMTDLALETELTREQREYLETVKSSSDSLLTVINDILDFSKIEAGKIELEIADFDLRECLETTLKTLALPADEKGLELLCEVVPEVREIVRGDASRLRQIVTNIVGNAIKFTHQGEVALKVQKEAQDGLADVLHFTVTDTGIGIPAHKRAIIFDPFTQADTSTTRKYGGTGLGLTISARLVRMMGGDIWVESEEGRGSRFHFTVRLAVAHRKDVNIGSIAPQPLVTRFSLGETRDAAEFLRVLVAEDNPVNQRLIVRFLEKRGHRVALVGNGREAVEALEKDRFDVVLMDLQMPEMDGLEATAAIRMKENGTGAHIAIIALTAHAMKGDREKCLGAGMDGYLTKPIQPQELDRVLEKYLQQH